MTDPRQLDQETVAAGERIEAALTAHQGKHVVFTQQPLDPLQQAQLRGLMPNREVVFLVESSFPPGSATIYDAADWKRRSARIKNLFLVTR